MARVLLLAAVAGVAAAGGHSKNWIDRYNAAPNPSSVVTAGALARFTVLTEGTVRMEYEDGGRFDDEPTIAVLNRYLPTPSFTTKTDAKTGVVTIKTSKWTLTYNPAGGAFSADNLRIVLSVEPFSTWTPGMEPTGNLHGTIRTLDRVGHAVDLKCPPVTTTVVYYTASWPAADAEGAGRGGSHGDEAGDCVACRCPR